MEPNMPKKRFVIVPVLCLLCAGLCAPALAQEENDEWVPVPLEEIEQATLRHMTPETQPTAPEVLPEADARQEATEESPDVRETPSSQPADSQPNAATTNAARLSPEEIARRLRSNGPSPVVPARGAKPKRTIDPTIATEGQAVAGRIGRIEKVNASGAYLVTFENNRTLPYESPRLLLPCRLLEELETHLEANPDARYRLSGETTRDGKHSYLLLQRVAIVDEGVTDVEPVAPPVDPTATPDTQPAGDETAGLIAQMLQDRPGTAVKITPSPHRKADENVASVAPAGKTPFTPGKQDLVVDRIIRVIREPGSEWWMARFESDNTLREPPLRILPGLRLEWIKMTMAESGKTDMLLRISGEITYYKGSRFLMLRKVLRQRDMDEF